MCQRHNCNPIKHLFGLCEHEQQVEEMRKHIKTTRSATTQDLRKFNRELNVILKDENIRVTLEYMEKARRV